MGRVAYSQGPGGITAGRALRASRRAGRCAVRAALLCIALALVGCGAERGDAPTGREGTAVARVVSLNPSLTAMLLAIGARDVLVGVDSFSARQQQAVADLPRVGGLFDPSLEAVLALEPDLVVVVPSAEQRGFRERLSALGIPVAVFDPKGFDDVVATLEALGARVGHAEQAARRAAQMRALRAAVAAYTAHLPRVEAVVVLQRDPLFVAGAATFVDDMLAAVGARNLGAQRGDGWPRASREWLIAAAPDVLVDTSRDPQSAAAFWRQWPSIPAVADGRVVAVAEREMTLPGPWLDRALLELLDAIRPGERARFETAAGLRHVPETAR